jgi:hypothetical protein
LSYILGQDNVNPIQVGIVQVFLHIFPLAQGGYADIPLRQCHVPQALDDDVTVYALTTGSGTALTLDAKPERRLGKHRLSHAHIGKPEY